MNKLDKDDEIDSCYSQMFLLVIKKKKVFV